MSAVVFTYDPLPIHKAFHATHAREKLLQGGVGSGKLGSLDTPILTRRGWITLGEIVVGDQVYDEQGHWCNVTAIYDDTPKSAYELEFDNGEVIHCGGEHLWTCWLKNDRDAFTGQNNVRNADGSRTIKDRPTTYPDDWPNWRSKYRQGSPGKRGPQTRDTNAIYKHYVENAGKPEWTGVSIPTTRPLDGHHQTDLPLDPYVLGYWLGDGSTGSGQLTAHEYDQHCLSDQLNEFRPHRVGKNPQTIGTYGLQAKLRELGVLNDKHVPALYLTASFEDRLALLQGLMDSDGSADVKACRVEFIQKRKHIAQAVFDLAVSLGQKPTIRSKRSTRNGRDYGEAWRVSWRPTQGIIPFRLERKALRVRDKMESGCYALRSQTHYLKDIRPAPIVPMRCLTVDSPNNLFLWGRSLIPTHNTIALCADAIMLGLTQPGSRILIGRKTIARLKETTEQEFINLLMRRPADRQEDENYQTLWDLCEKKKGGGHYDTITFPNGTEFLFRALEDYKGLMSLNLTAIYIDEASEVLPQAYDDLMSRLRQSEPTPAAQEMGYTWGDVPRHVMALASNPYGHNWVWHKYINPKTPPSKLGRVFFRSTTFDNPYLPEGFVDSLLERPIVWQNRFVYCEDGDFAGQILSFNEKEMVVTPFVPPKEWKRGMGLDWGLRSPTAVVWWAQDPSTNIWIQYREWQTYDPTDPLQKESYQTTNVHEVAKQILEIEKEADEKITWRAADPQISEKQASDGKSIQWWFRQHGLNFVGGLKHHEPRINALNSMLYGGKLQVMECCPQTITSFQQYQWEEVKLASGERDQPERPRKKDDHLVDASQYLATLILPETRKRIEERGMTADERAMKAMRKQWQEKRMPAPSGFGYV